jgi:hypothetical protein
MELDWRFLGVLLLCLEARQGEAASTSGSSIDPLAPILCTLTTRDCTYGNDLKSQKAFPDLTNVTHEEYKQIIFPLLDELSWEDSALNLSRVGDSESECEAGDSESGSAVGDSESELEREDSESGSELGDSERELESEDPADFAKSSWGSSIYELLRLRKPSEY